LDKQKKKKKRKEIQKEIQKCSKKKKNVFFWFIGQSRKSGTRKLLRIVTILGLFTFISFILARTILFAANPQQISIPAYQNSIPNI